MQITIKDVVLQIPHFQFENPVNLQINHGEHWAFIGRNGSGKTLLADTLAGKHALKSGYILCVDEDGCEYPVSSVVKAVAFRDIYSIIDTQNSYYQQRWNKGDEQDMPLVRDLLSSTGDDWLEMLIKWFGISAILDKEINLLSSGELRKFLIVRSLLPKPRILILDNPFIGLDAASRIILTDTLEKLGQLDNLQIILVLSNPEDIPAMITHILPIESKKLLSVIKGEDFFKDKGLMAPLFKDREDLNVSFLKKDTYNDVSLFEYAAILKDIYISYGSRTILNDLNWNVKRGEKWALLGENGSGKSTLLSLICGDNPQAYANNITLFDKKRGTGESIWDIKKRIGYISPEMHLYYQKNVSCLHVVGSGFFDTIGLYRKCNSEQEQIALEWMDIFGIKHLKDISFLNISSGEQRLVLLARVFVKNPDLLILDEPLHGLDVVNKRLVKKLIEVFCTDEKSLIYVTHYENEIPSVINKRFVLKKQ